MRGTSSKFDMCWLFQRNQHENVTLLGTEKYSEADGFPRSLLIVLHHVYSQLSMVLRWSLFTASRGILIDNSLCDFPKLVRKSSLAPFIPEHSVEKLADEYGVPALVKTLINSALWMCMAGPPCVALRWLTLGLIHFCTFKKCKIKYKSNQTLSN